MNVKRANLLYANPPARPPSFMPQLCGIQSIDNRREVVNELIFIRLDGDLDLNGFTRDVFEAYRL